MTALLAGSLALAACSDGKESRATATAPPAGPAAAGTSTPVPAAPSAARISGLPQTPAGSSGTPAPAGEALLHRAVLFVTDLPPGLQAQPLVADDLAALAARAPDPAAFVDRARRWGRTASLRAAFDAADTARLGLRAVRSATIAFATEDGARAQFETWRAEGYPAVLVATGLAGDPLLAGEATAAGSPAVGDEALAWQLRADAGGMAIAFRRGAVVAVVAVTGEEQTGGLARTLDQRLAEGQRR